MKKGVIKISFFTLIFLITCVVSSSAASPDMSGNTDAKHENADSIRGQVSQALAGIEISGGISAVKNLYGSESSIGGAVYICPNFGNFSIPLRFEYINQKNSRILIESPDTEDIYAATFSPTWHYNDNTYIRAEASYVKADDGFIDEDGRIKDDRISMAIELGFTF